MSASSSGYHWDHVKHGEPEDTHACHTIGAPISPGGWRQRAKTKVDTCRRFRYHDLTSMTRQFTKFTRHFAGTTENLTISPHGWVRWVGVWRELDKAGGNAVNAHMILSHLVTDCGGTVHGSGGESATGAGTAKGHIRISPQRCHG